MYSRQPVCELVEFWHKVKKRIWYFGIAAWLVVILEKASIAFSDNHFYANHFAHLLLTIFCSVSWLCLKPNKLLNSSFSESQE